jgi:hypothetical protein
MKGKTDTRAATQRAFWEARDRQDEIVCAVRDTVDGLTSSALGGACTDLKKTVEDVLADEIKDLFEDDSAVVKALRKMIREEVATPTKFKLLIDALRACRQAMLLLKGDAFVGSRIPVTEDRYPSLKAANAAEKLAAEALTACGETP